MGLPQIEIGSGMLGDALLASVEVIQELNRHWWCTVVCRQTEDQPLPVEEFLGQTISVKTLDEDGVEHLIFSGFVLDVERLTEIWGSSGARIRAVSSSYKLDLTERKQYYAALTLEQVASQAAAHGGVSVAVHATPQKALNYVQYGETDFAFLNRIADDYESWLRPEEGGVAIYDRFQPGATVAWRGQDGLVGFKVKGKLSPAAFSGSHYDHHAMVSGRYDGVGEAAEFYPSLGPLVDAVQAQSKSLLPDGFAAQRARVMTQGDYEQKLRGESKRSIGGSVTAMGESRNQQLMAGNTVAIEGGIDAAGTYGLLKVVHQWTPVGYGNSFVCTPWKRYRSAEAPVLRSWQGVVPARVVAHDDPKKMGRLRVQFFWQGEGAGHWARWVSPHAGPERGMMFLPEVGDEVAVVFEDGDPERPVVLGAMWNGVHAAPRGEFFGGDIAPNNIKRIVTKSGNRLQMIDTPGRETVVVATPNHAAVSMTERAAATGRPMMVVHSDGDIVLAAPEGRVHVQSKFFSAEVGDIEEVAVASQPASTTKSGFALKSPEELAKLSKKERMAYRNALIGAGRKKAEQMPPGSDRQALAAACDRFERNNQAMEMANLSEAVYKDSGAPEGWTRLTDPDKLSKLPPELQNPALWNNAKYNYHAGLFQNEQGEIVMAERGTNPKNWQDIKADFVQGWGSKSEQYDEGINLARLAKKSLGDSLIRLTGHSLGGGRSGAESAVTGVPATTFNAAGVNANTVAPYNASLTQAAGRVTNYNVDGQILNDLHGVSLAGHTAPDPLGKDIPLPAVDEKGNAMHFPSAPIVPENKWNPSQEMNYIGRLKDYEVAKYGQEVQRHSLTTIQNGLEKEKRDDTSTIGQKL